MAGAIQQQEQHVIVLRHGERRDSAINALAEVNPPLTEQGKAAVKKAAQEIKAAIGEAKARELIVVTSPFLRCIETAEMLQRCGIGVTTPVRIDCAVCEVFGPSRIKATSKPTFDVCDSGSGCSAGDVIGVLPEWGETLDEAYTRYRSSFMNWAALGASGGGAMMGAISPGNQLTPQRLGAAPVLLPPSTGGSSTPPIQSGAHPVRRRCHTHQQQQQRHRSMNDNGNSNNNGSSQTITDSNADHNSQRPRDVIIVTHGDAVSAVLSAFYPARTIYETCFLSHIVMKRYGLHNGVFHLESSVGVNWIVDGLDEEPHDPVYQQLHQQARVAHRVNRVMPLPSSSDSDRSSGYDDDGMDDDGGGSNSNDEEYGNCSVPLSSVNRRPRGDSGNAPRRHQLASVTAAPVKWLTPTLERSPTPPPATTVLHCHSSRTTREGSRSSPTVSTPISNDFSAIPSSTEPTTLPAAIVHPNGCEGCEKVRLPIGTLLQSSVISPAHPPMSFGHTSFSKVNADASGEGDDDNQSVELCDFCVSDDTLMKKSSALDSEVSGQVDGGEDGMSSVMNALTDGARSSTVAVSSTARVERETCSTQSQTASVAATSSALDSNVVVRGRVLAGPHEPVSETVRVPATSTDGGTQRVRGVPHSTVSTTTRTAAVCLTVALRALCALIPFGALVLWRHHRGDAGVFAASAVALEGVQGLLLYLCCRQSHRSRRSDVGAANSLRVAIEQLRFINHAFGGDSPGSAGTTSSFHQELYEDVNHYEDYHGGEEDEEAHISSVTVFPESRASRSTTARLLGSLRKCENKQSKVCIAVRNVGASLLKLVVIFLVFLLLCSILGRQTGLSSFGGVFHSFPELLWLLCCFTMNAVRGITDEPGINQFLEM